MSRQLSMQNNISLKFSFKLGWRRSLLNWYVLLKHVIITCVFNRLCKYSVDTCQINTLNQKKMPSLPPAHKKGKRCKLAYIWAFNMWDKIPTIFYRRRKQKPIIKKNPMINQPASPIAWITFKQVRASNNSKNEPDCIHKGMIHRFRERECNDPPSMTQYCPLLAPHIRLPRRSPILGLLSQQLA